MAARVRRWRNGRIKGRLFAAHGSVGLDQAGAFPCAACRALGPGDPRFPHPALSNPQARGRAGNLVGRRAAVAAAGRSHHGCNGPGFLAVRDFRYRRRRADRRLADGRSLYLSAAGVLAVDPENRDRAAVRRVVRLRHVAESAVGLPARIFSGRRFGRAGVQIGRTRYARSRPRDGSQSAADFPAWSACRMRCRRFSPG